MSVIAADPAALAVVDVVAGHAYEYNPNSTSRPEQSFNGYGRPVWMTEWSYDVYADDVTIANGVEWALNVWSLLVEAEVSAVHHWWAVNFLNDGRQQGLINAVDGEADFELTKRLFTIGQFSRFVRPGWVRLEATKKPHGDVSLAAFRDPASGEFAVVAINEGGGEPDRRARLRRVHVRPNHADADDGVGEPRHARRPRRGGAGWRSRSRPSP